MNLFGEGLPGGFNPVDFIVCAIRDEWWIGTARVYSRVQGRMKPEEGVEGGFPYLLLGFRESTDKFSPCKPIGMSRGKYHGMVSVKGNRSAGHDSVS